MVLTSVADVVAHVADAVSIDDSQVTVQNEFLLPEKMDKLAHTAVFGEGLTRDFTRWLIWELGQAVGVYPSSIHELYMAIGRGDVPANFTVPAINVRAINYYMSRAVFRAANVHDAGAILFEIARSETGYTDQRPAEYVACVISAGIREGYRGPVFIQGDHFQVSGKNYKADAEKEVQAVKDLMREAIGAGYYNIDIDTSTLVDLSYESLDEQQKVNYTLCAELSEYARSLEPAGITISLGGEIGEVGHKNSTVEELHAFMQGYNKQIEGVVGISKISVQTGTSHGGVVLPDGSLAQVKVDFDTLKELSRVAREDYGLGGAVQHGASTLPAELFDKFAEYGAVEIHLATNFQNIIFDHAPEALVSATYAHIKEHNGNEWKEGQTEDQFLYKTRKKAIGPFKAEFWAMETRDEACQALQAQFEFLFDKLNITGTRQTVIDVTTRVTLHRPRPEAAIIQEDLEIASDLAD